MFLTETNHRHDVNQLIPLMAVSSRLGVSGSAAVAVPIWFRLTAATIPTPTDAAWPLAAGVPRFHGALRYIEHAEQID